MITTTDGGSRAVASLRRRLAWVAAVGLLTIALAGVGRQAVPRLGICRDVICFWAAGKILVSGRSPYDADLQMRVQRSAGWDRERDGAGRYEFMPYFYPPWFAALCAPLALLGYPGARVAVFVVDVELLLLGGYLLKGAIPEVPGSIPIVAVPTFAFSLGAVVAGQTSPLALVLVVAAWRLLEGGRDRSAGAVLAWLAFKPQLTAVVIGGVLLWSMRRGRWGVVGGCLTTLALLVLGFALIVPGWPAQLIAALREYPPPTAHVLGMGASWYAALKTIGLRGWALGLVYAAGAAAAVAAVLRATGRDRPLHDVLALGLLGAFVVVPYGRYYDYLLLLIPCLVLVGRRLREVPATALLVVVYFGSFLHFAAFVEVRRRLKGVLPIDVEFLFVWVPLLLAGTWAASRPRKSEPPEPAVTARPG